MSWEQLIQIKQEAEDIAREELAEKANPSQCPRCTGELESGPSGQLHCRYDGWTQNC